MRFSAGQAALKFNKLGPVHFIDIRANIEVRSGAAELKRGHAALLSNNPNTDRRPNGHLCDYGPGKSYLDQVMNEDYPIRGVRKGFS